MSNFSSCSRNLIVLAIRDFACLHTFDEPLQAHNIWLLSEIFDILELLALMKVFVVENYEMGCAVIFELSLETVELNQFSEDYVICNV